MSTESKARLLRFWRNYARPFLFILIILTAFRSSIADWNDVPSGSMKPSIVEGDRIFVNKLAYDLKVPFTTWHIVTWGGPQRGDVVVFYSPADGTRLVKRAVAIPGDTVEMRSERLIINGKEAKYAPLDTKIVDEIPSAERPQHAFAAESIDGQHHPVMITPAIGAMRTFGPITLNSDEYFMMGDNRDNSADSRYFGPVSRKLIVGRASRVIASVDINDGWAPRWARFFKALP